MSRETAHQLGTPLSSLMAWIELLKMQNVDDSIIEELQKDTSRLEMISRRFSKIGSKAELYPIDLISTIQNTTSYLRTRISKNIEIECDFRIGKNAIIEANTTLLEWVIENICKNAVDAIEHSGKITIVVKQTAKNYVVDITDTGRGIASSKFKSVFKPGYTTKKRGWGLGLSLAKRIIENHHNGKLFVKWSEIKKGTTFRIVLNPNR